MGGAPAIVLKYMRLENRTLSREWPVSTLKKQLVFADIEGWI